MLKIFKILTLLKLYLLLFSNDFLIAQNKIIYLISPPRSLSVAFLRMMEARKDFKIMHEPSQCAFSSKYYYELTKSWFYKDAPKTFEEVKQKIFSEAKQSNVFIKEMSFAVKNFLLNDNELVKNKNVYFVFLIRNPHHTVISLYKKVPNIIGDFSGLVGYKSTYEIYKDVQKRSPNTPVIIFSEDLYKNPEKTIELFCKQLQIPYKKEALNWNDLGQDFSGVQEWHELKNKELTHHWHGDAIRSSKFILPEQYKVNQNGPTFDEINNLQDKEACLKAYKENLMYYNLISNEKELYAQKL